jgi:methyltransferase (TIGR00027 family)
MTADDALRDVSDTALWVAFYRAMETERTDAIFRDPFARRLAGERGERIVRTLRGGRRNAWSMIVRTALFDEIVQRVIGSGEADVVVNLAAGLDARPYRLELPAGLRWIEVDLPALIAYKESHLGKDTPRCRLERVALDLANREERRRLFARLDADARGVLVLTEGLLTYLRPEAVGELAADLHAQAHFKHWATDLASPRVKQMIEKYWGKHLRAASAPMHFAPAEGEAFFRPYGWDAVEFHDLFGESRRLGRTMPWMGIARLQMRLFPRRAARMMKLWRSGVTLLRRT